ncbi:MAG: FMN-binding protein [Clostridiales bacterium]
MKKGYTFTILFIFVVTAFFTSILAVANSYYQDDINENEALSNRRSVMYSFMGYYEETDDKVNSIYDTHVEELEIDGEFVYAYIENSEVTAYTLPMSGSGLWGTITGYLAVSDDLSKIVGIDFMSHSETPGLGARIDEEWFKKQFQNLSFSLNSKLSLINQGEGDIDAITGATTTSRYVVQLVDNTLEKYIKLLEVNR